MARIMIACPRTGRPVDTGIDIDEEGFKSADLGRNTVTCPHCGLIHTWQKAQAYLEKL